MTARPGDAAPPRARADPSSGDAGPSQSPRPGVRPAGPAPADLRLAAPAIVAWVAAVAATRVGTGRAAAAGLGSGVAALALLAVAVRAVRAPRAWVRATGSPALHPRSVPSASVRPRSSSSDVVGRRGRAAASLALGLAVAAAVLASGTAQRDATTHGLLPDAARDGATVRLVATVTGDPRTQAPAWPGAPARVTVVVEARHVSSRGRESRAVGQVLVAGPSAWSDVPYRSEVEVSGRVTAESAGGRTVAILATAAPPHVVRGPPAWARTTSAVRARVLTLAERQPGDGGALLAGIVVGDTSRIPADLTVALRTAGLTHVTAVSGAHFSLVVALVLAMATTARAPRPVRALAALLATGATVALVHPDPSVLRAAAMGLVAVVGLVAGRRAAGPAALATGVVLLLVVDPWLATEIGFLLSVLATAGLVLAGRRLTERWSPRLGRTAAEALALPVVAQLCCAPVLLLLTPAVATYAIPANVLAAPAVGPATVLGLLAGVVDPVCPAAAQALAACAGAACWWVATVARLTSAAPGARADWLPGPAGLVVLVVAAACTLLLALWRRTR